jgi:excisionase family DNA binding protein
VKTNPSIVLGVLIPHEVAAEVDDILNEGLSKHRDPISPRTRDVIAGIRQLAAASARHVVIVDNAPPPGPLSPVSLEGVNLSGEEVTVPVAASRLGCSRQAVLARIARESLPARRDGRRWLIAEENLTTKGTK